MAAKPFWSLKLIQFNKFIFKPPHFLFLSYLQNLPRILKTQKFFKLLLI